MLLRDSEREIKKVWRDDLCHLFLISDNHLLIFLIWGTDMSFLSDISLFFSEKYWRYLLWWKRESFEVSVRSVDHTVSILIRWSFLSKKCSSWFKLSEWRYSLKGLLSCNDINWHFDNLSCGLPVECCKSGRNWMIVISFAIFLWLRQHWWIRFDFSVKFHCSISLFDWLYKHYELLVVLQFFTVLIFADIFLEEYVLSL